MILSISERLYLLSILPQEGSLITIKIVRKLRESLSFSEEEHKLFNIKMDMNSDGSANVTWDNEAESKHEPIDIVITEKAKEFIIETFKELDKNNKFSEVLLDIYDKFVNDDNE